MRLAMVSGLLATLACAHPQIKHELLFAGDRVVEKIPLPPNPAVEDLNTFPGFDSDIFPIKKDAPSPLDGFVVSERRAARDGKYRVRYKELRKILEADRKEWSGQRMLYEEQLGQAEQKISDLQPSWFETHKGALGFIGGFVLATAGTIAVALAVH